MEEGGPDAEEGGSDGEPLGTRDEGEEDGGLGAEGAVGGANYKAGDSWRS